MIFSQLFFLYGCSNINSIVEDITNLAPYVLVTGRLDNPEQAFLVVDKKIVSELQTFLDVPFSLMSAFFVFNIQYLVGCCNFYTFMELLILNLKMHQ